MTESQTIEAVYENGIFRPIHPVTGLVEHSKVTLAIAYETPTVHPLANLRAFSATKKPRKSKRSLQQNLARLMQVAGEIALDTSIAIRYLNGDEAVVRHVLALPNVILPLTVVGELLFGAANSARAAKNLSRYLAFIDACSILPMKQETAISYYQVRLHLKQKGTPIPENDVWIAAQCVENQWTLATNDAHFGNVDGLTVEHWSM